MCMLLISGDASTIVGSSSTGATDASDSCQGKKGEMRRKRFARLQPGAKMKPSMYSLKAHKLETRMARIKKRAARQQRKTLAQKKALKALEERKASSNLFFCCLEANGNAFCTRAFKKKGNLLLHLKSKRHTMGVSSARPGKVAAGERLLSTTDRLKRLAADAQVGAAAIRDARESKAVEISDEGSYRLVNGEMFALPCLPCGWANKGRRAGKKRYTTAQLEFLQWCYLQGVQDKAKKFTAEAAERVMPLHGTVEGAKRFPGAEYWNPRPDGRPTFRLFELLDHWTIKPWFSQQKAAFDKTLASAMTNAATKIDAQNFVDETVEEDGGDE